MIESWEYNKLYKAGDLVNFCGKIFRCTRNETNDNKCLPPQVYDDSSIGPQQDEDQLESLSNLASSLGVNLNTNKSWELV